MAEPKYESSPPGCERSGSKHRAKSRETSGEHQSEQDWGSALVFATAAFVDN
jgi:hypothetical protein